MYRFSILAVLAVTFVVCPATAADRSNVLMISIDDLNDWTGYLGGHPDVQTPHLDRLSEMGRNFENAHCAVPVCSPSRVSVMSGVSASTHGSYELGPAYETLESLKDVPCIQEYFQANGYTTISGGKVLHHGFRGRLASAIDRDLDKRKGGPRPKSQMNWPGGAWDWGAFPENDDEMFDHQLAEKAADVLAEKFEKPFFLSVGLFRPHVPMFVPQKWYDLYDRESITLPENPLSDLDDLPPNFIGLNQIAPNHAEVLEHNSWRGMVHAYLASVSFVDSCVGIVLDGLEAGPHRDNTIVVLWSDHGFHLGEKQHWAKRTLWEESTRVPFLVAGPGISPGEPCREAVSLLDLYPTLVDLCDLPENAHLEGQSLRPQLEDPKAERETPAVIASYFGNYAVRSRDWRYIRYKDGSEELYDHRIDSDEFTNLGNRPEFREIKSGLEKWIPKEAAPEVKPVSEQDPNAPRKRKR